MTLREAADMALENAREAFKKQDGNPAVYIVLSDDTYKILRPPGHLMEHGISKKFLFRALGDVSRQAGAKFLVIVTDAWTLDLTPAQLERLDKDATYKEAFDRATGENGLVAAAAAGFGKLVEIITVSAQAKHEFVHLIQPYERVRVIPPTAVRSGADLGEHEIRFSGDLRTITSDDGGTMEGRIMTFYEGPEVNKC